MGNLGRQMKYSVCRGMMQITDLLIQITYHLI